MLPDSKTKLGAIVLLVLFYFSATHGLLDRTSSYRTTTNQIQTHSHSRELTGSLRVRDVPSRRIDKSSDTQQLKQSRDALPIFTNKYNRDLNNNVVQSRNTVEKLDRGVDEEQYRKMQSDNPLMSSEKRIVFTRTRETNSGSRKRTFNDQRHFRGTDRRISINPTTQYNTRRVADEARRIEGTYTDRTVRTRQERTSQRNARGENNRRNTEHHLQDSKKPQRVEREHLIRNNQQSRNVRTLVEPITLHLPQNHRTTTVDQQNRQIRMVSEISHNDKRRGIADQLRYSGTSPEKREYRRSSSSSPIEENGKRYINLQHRSATSISTRLAEDRKSEQIRNNDRYNLSNNRRTSVEDRKSTGSRDGSSEINVRNHMQRNHIQVKLDNLASRRDDTLLRSYRSVGEPISYRASRLSGTYLAKSDEFNEQKTIKNIRENNERKSSNLRFHGAKAILERSTRSMEIRTSQRSRDNQQSVSAENSLVPVRSRQDGVFERNARNRIRLDYGPMGVDNSQSRREETLLRRSTRSPNKYISDKYFPHSRTALANSEISTKGSNSHSKIQKNKKGNLNLQFRGARSITSTEERTDHTRNADQPNRRASAKYFFNRSIKSGKNRISDRDVRNRSQENRVRVGIDNFQNRREEILHRPIRSTEEPISNTYSKRSRTSSQKLKTLNSERTIIHNTGSILERSTRSTPEHTFEQTRNNVQRIISNKRSASIKNSLRRSAKSTKDGVSERNIRYRVRENRVRERVNHLQSRHEEPFRFLRLDDASISRREFRNLNFAEQQNSRRRVVAAEQRRLDSSIRLQQERTFPRNIREIRKQHQKQLFESDGEMDERRIDRSQRLTRSIEKSAQNVVNVNIRRQTRDYSNDKSERSLRIAQSKSNLHNMLTGRDERHNGHRRNKMGDAENGEITNGNAHQIPHSQSKLQGTRSDLRTSLNRRSVRQEAEQNGRRQPDFTRTSCNEIGSYVRDINMNNIQNKIRLSTDDEQWLMNQGHSSSNRIVFRQQDKGVYNIQSSFKQNTHRLNEENRRAIDRHYSTLSKNYSNENIKNMETITWISIVKILLLSITIAQIITSASPKVLGIHRLANFLAVPKEKVC